VLAFQNFSSGFSGTRQVQKNLPASRRADQALPAFGFEKKEVCERLVAAAVMRGAEDREAVRRH